MLFNISDEMLEKADKVTLIALGALLGWRVQKGGATQADNACLGRVKQALLRLDNGQDDNTHQWVLPILSVKRQWWWQPRSLKQYCANKGLTLQDINVGTIDALARSVIANVTFLSCAFKYLSDTGAEDAVFLNYVLDELTRAPNYSNADAKAVMELLTALVRKANSSDTFLQLALCVRLKMAHLNPQRQVGAFSEMSPTRIKLYLKSLLDKACSIQKNTKGRYEFVAEKALNFSKDFVFELFVYGDMHIVGTLRHNESRSVSGDDIEALCKCCVSMGCSIQEIFLRFSHLEKNRLFNKYDCIEVVNALFRPDIALEKVKSLMLCLATMTGLPLSHVLYHQETMINRLSDEMRHQVLIYLSLNESYGVPSHAAIACQQYWQKIKELTSSQAWDDEKQNMLVQMVIDCRSMDNISLTNTQLRQLIQFFFAF
jgi:hypothetical protein